MCRVCGTHEKKITYSFMLGNQSEEKLGICRRYLENNIKMLLRE
jgi:hypothetical protein